MIGYRPCGWWRLLWCYITPGLILVSSKWSFFFCLSLPVSLSVSFSLSRVPRCPWFPWIPLNFEIYFQTWKLLEFSCLCDMAHSLKLCTISVTCVKKLKCFKIVQIYFYIKYNILRLLSCRKKTTYSRMSNQEIYFICAIQLYRERAIIPTFCHWFCRNCATRQTRTLRTIKLNFNIKCL